MATVQTVLFSALSVFITVVLSVPTQVAAQTANNARLSEQQPVILILGDSLSSAYGIRQSSGWVSLLADRLRQLNLDYQVVNTSISGETTQGGVQRLPKLLDKYQPAYVIIELGGNDGLRGLSLQQIKNNLQMMISKSLQSNADVILTGIQLPPNYGQFYTKEFYRMYTELSEHNKVTLVPHLLEDVATEKSLMQQDGIHPVAAAQEIILNNVWEVIEPILKKK